MPRTTPLAPWMSVRTLLVFAILLTTTACGSKQYSTKQVLADETNSTESIAASFEPASPFLRMGGNQFCTLPVPSVVAGTKNPFDLVSMSGSTTNQRLLALAFSQIGTLYRPGGTEPSTGFDCSGFTTWVYSKLGVNLPRSSREQFQEGKVIAKSQLRKGDLVFFGNKHRITHVGIYLEDNKFIHSSSSGDTVKISSLDEPTWERKYTGARRVF
ncbi:C40 family peptidase [Fundidesulfovibrio agrisoli]|uniref:C40 family peptidase n=1 Tax=Fundidesulfovibrio agrisoli TaxID=2922717 RepID=UPI001FAB7326|nr:C40 family peptidase [Fundidesulfovibrio agrisoli]